MRVMRKCAKTVQTIANPLNGCLAKNPHPSAAGDR
jgi:hypothetical protein